MHKSFCMFLLTVVIFHRFVHLYLSMCVYQSICVFTSIEAYGCQKANVCQVSLLKIQYLRFFIRESFKIWLCSSLSLNRCIHCQSYSGVYHILYTWLAAHSLESLSHLHQLLLLQQSPYPIFVSFCLIFVLWLIGFHQGHPYGHGCGTSNWSLRDSQSLDHWGQCIFPKATIESQ